MGDQISCRVELAVKPGKLDNFLALTGEMVEATLEELDTLSYERFVTDDGKFVHVYERYADSAAALMHLRKFGKISSASGSLKRRHRSEERGGRQEFQPEQRKVFGTSASLRFLRPLATAWHRFRK